MSKITKNITPDNLTDFNRYFTIPILSRFCKKNKTLTPLLTNLLPSTVFDDGG